MSTVNVFIRKLQRWRNDIRESGPLPCWLTTVGRSPEMLLSSYTSDRQSEVASRSGLLLSLNVWCTYFLNTGCPRMNVKYFGRVFLMLNYTDITQNIYVQSWTVTEIMAREKCGHLAFPRTVRLQLCSALTSTEQCSTHLCDGTSSAQRDKIVFHYCRYSCAMYSSW